MHTRENGNNWLYKNILDNFKRKKNGFRNVSFVANKMSKNMFAEYKRIYSVNWERSKQQTMKMRINFQPSLFAPKK